MGKKSVLKIREKQGGGRLAPPPVHSGQSAQGAHSLREKT